jgi:hypothetical protein
MTCSFALYDARCAGVHAQPPACGAGLSVLLIAAAVWLVRRRGA